MPLDECLVQAAVDLSGRPYVVHEEPQLVELIGSYDTTLTRHIWESLVATADIALHVRVLSGRNAHHVVEAQFKAVARALRDAVALDARVAGVPSTKGTAVSERSACGRRGRDRVGRRPRLRLGQPALGRAGARPHRRRRHGDQGLRRPRSRPTASSCPASGAYAACMRGLHLVRGGTLVVGPAAQARPVLGICVGMQVLFEEGVEHGERTEGIGVLDRRGHPARGPRRAAHGLEHRRGARGLGAVRRARAGALLLRPLLRRAARRAPSRTR